jgi:hypothetical protein
MSQQSQPGMAASSFRQFGDVSMLGVNDAPQIYSVSPSRAPPIITW